MQPRAAANVIANLQAVTSFGFRGEQSPLLVAEEVVDRNAPLLRHQALPAVPALDLCAETGELAQEILRDSGYGKRGAARPSERTVAELGDSLFSLLCMANEMNVDVEEVLRVTLARYQKRLPRRADHGILGRRADAPSEQQDQ